MHIPKCAGTEIRNQIAQVLNDDEILTLYESATLSPQILNYEDCDRYINSMTDKLRQTLDGLQNELRERKQAETALKQAQV
jgi:phosphoglycerate-specific signal transduction histidine kinase